MLRHAKETMFFSRNMAVKHYEVVRGMVEIQAQAAPA